MTNYRSAYGNWEQSICRANYNVDCSHTLLALFYYQQAIQLSDELINLRPTSQQSIGAMLVSHHNLAQLYTANRAYRLAWQCYFSARSKIHDIQRVCNKPCGSLWGSLYAYSQLCRFEQQYGAYGVSTSDGCHGSLPLSFRTLLQIQTH